MENRAYTTFQEMGDTLTLNEDNDNDDDMESKNNIFNTEVRAIDLLPQLIETIKKYPNSEKHVSILQAWINDKYKNEPDEFELPKVGIDDQNNIHYAIIINLLLTCLRLRISRFDFILWLLISMFETDGMHHLFIECAKVLLILSKMAYVLKDDYVKYLMVRLLVIFVLCVLLCERAVCL